MSPRREAPASHVFLSYSRQDADFCLRVAKDLKSVGVEAWIDQDDIPAGELWDRAVESALRAASIVVPILSPTAVSSENVLDEISYARKNRVHIIPVLYRPCDDDVPLRLHRLQYVDFTGDYDTALNQLVDRLKPLLSKPEADAELKTVLMGDLVDRTRLVGRLGDRAAADLFRRHGRLVSDLLEKHGGQGADRADRFLLLFDRPIQAVLYALAYHRALKELTRVEGVKLEAGVAIHLGEILVRQASPEDVTRGARPLVVEGLAKAMTEQLMSLAQGRQTLMNQAAFDTARRAAAGADPAAGELRWLAHGDYRLKGMPTPEPVFEVGTEGLSCLSAPPDSATMHRVTSEETILGWRPAGGLEIPRRRHWVLRRKLGEGGYGEVWLARHEKTRDRRAFKFCFEAERLKALRREITLFRLLKETLGEREDIARILDWSFDEAPYFIESEYTAGGNLVEWARAHGGIERVDLQVRLELVAQVGDALAAAHSVGVLHKDVKPGNVLIYTDLEGRPRARLTDFGIGLVTDESRLLAAGITVLSMTDLKAAEDPSPTGGTRLYMAPELVEGRAPTVQADLYALGVILYQLVVGDFTRSLAPGWRRGVSDELLREAIGWAVDGTPERRLADGGRLAKRLRNLDRRRAELEAERHAREDTARTKAALAQARRRRKVVLSALVGLFLIAGAMGIVAFRLDREKERADSAAEVTQQVLDFVIDLFENSDPARAQGEEITVRQILDRGAEKIAQQLEDQPLVQARIQKTVGNIYQKLGLYGEAAALLEAALTTQIEDIGEIHPDTIDTLELLGENAYYQGKYKSAVEHFHRSLTMRQQTLGPDHPDLAGSLSNLAALYEFEGNYAEAAAYYQRALEIDEKYLGPDHPYVSATLNNFAILRRKQGEYDEAEALHRRAVEIDETNLGPDHPELAKSLSSWASTYEAQGSYAQAEALAQRALEIRDKVLDSDHPDRAHSLCLLAEIYRGRGNVAEAEDLFRQAQGIWETSLDESHPNQAKSLIGLANLYRDQRRYAEAEPLYERALSILTTALGPGSADVIDLSKEYAILFRATGRAKEADELEARSPDSGGGQTDARL